MRVPMPMYMGFLPGSLSAWVGGSLPRTGVL